MIHPENYDTYEEWFAAAQAADPDLRQRVSMDTIRFPVGDETSPEGYFPNRKWWEYRTSPAYLSGQNQRLSTATWWALHLQVGEVGETVDAEQVEDLAKRILATGAECLTGEYIGGDSFHEWAEIYEGPDEDPGDMGRALHIYFTAPNVDAAVTAAQHICQAISANHPKYLDPHNVCLSTGGDWAEQAEVWEVAHV